jgi:hypothetical protein
MPTVAGLKPGDGYTAVYQKMKEPPLEVVCRKAV